jgi:hypothetical protein
MQHTAAGLKARTHLQRRAEVVAMVAFGGDQHLDRRRPALHRELQPPLRELGVGAQLLLVGPLHHLSCCAVLVHMQLHLQHTSSQVYAFPPTAGADNDDHHGAPAECRGARDLRG